MPDPVNADIGGDTITQDLNPTFQTLNPGPSSEAAAKLFVHMANHVAKEHCAATKELQ